MATICVGVERLFTRSFFLVCFVALATFTSFHLLLPTLPVYVLRLGGHEAEVGIIVGAVTITGVIIRILAGGLTDRYGRRVVLLTGQVGFLLSMVLYIFATTIPVLAALRLVHGLAWGAASTSFTTLVADVAPPARRGEAIGFFGLAANVGMAIGPALGMFIVNGYSFTALFLTASALALVALMAGLALPEPSCIQPGPALPSVTANLSVLSLHALFPAIMLFFVTISYGSIVSFVPLYATSAGVDNPGLFFTVYATVIMVSRPICGRLSDKWGRWAVILPGLMLIAASMAVLSISGTLPVLLLVGLLYGLGFGAVHPALMALAVDLVPAQSRGTALGYFTASFDLGVAVGAIGLGFVIQPIGYGNMFISAGLIPLLALAAFLMKDRQLISR